ncbi:grpE protein homolog 2, mitochondrial isoform X2 [Mercurialis annua]|uniref:grpE protein homolog 2, mitochondrial isoform X2 n=1 Tax=Mercurialis annua TaxID=3986 RepID=UPI00215E6694|nr:grpE protein homolog 2, mitochondrial isoform X2 [Mercurialis annua]
MSMSRVALSRVSRSVGRRSPLLLLSPSQKLQQSPIFSNQIDSLVHLNPNQFVAGQVSLFHHSAFSSSPFQRFGFASSASPEANEKEGGTAEKNGDASNAESEKSNGESKLSDRPEDSTSDSDAEEDLSMDDLVKLVAEKEELLKLKHKEVEKMQDKVLRTYAEMENVMERTKREAENTKKFSIQNFAKNLLDVADNLGRASSVVKESFSKIDTSTDSAGAVPLLKTLLEGVEMTEKQLADVFRKFGIEKYVPVDEPFDPHKHNAVFQVPDSSKPPGTVAAVLKAGYVLHERVIRPAEVGVTAEVENDTESNSNN